MEAIRKGCTMEKRFYKTDWPMTYFKAHFKRITFLNKTRILSSFKDRKLGSYPLNYQNDRKLIPSYSLGTVAIPTSRVISAGAYARAIF